MDVFLTGGTGLVGSAVLTALLAEGHSVSALARSDGSAQRLEAAGATVVRGDLTDTDVLVAAAAKADGVIHTGSPGDGSNPDVDAAVVEALVPVAGGKPWVHTSGIWIHGSNTAIDEDSPFDPPMITAWRLPLDAAVRAAGGSVVAPGIVYGRGGGIPAFVLMTGPQADGALLFPGSGDQHWVTVHTDDLAQLYVLALTGPAGAYWLGAGGESPTVRAIAEAASHGLGLDGQVAPEPAEGTQARLGPMTEALLLDQVASGAKARQELGWEPSQRSILDDLTTGSYVSS